MLRILPFDHHPEIGEIFPCAIQANGFGFVNFIYRYFVTLFLQTLSNVFQPVVVGVFVEEFVFPPGDSALDSKLYVSQCQFVNPIPQPKIFGNFVIQVTLGQGGKFTSLGGGEYGAKLLGSRLYFGRLLLALIGEREFKTVERTYSQLLYVKLAIYDSLSVFLH